MHEMLGIALKGLPRDSYRLMSKYRTPNVGDPLPKLDLYRKQLNTEYLDIMLLHCVRPATWATDYRDIQDAFLEAQQRKVVLARGASVHGLPFTVMPEILQCTLGQAARASIPRRHTTSCSGERSNG